METAQSSGVSFKSRGQMVQFGSFFGCDTKSSRSGGTSAAGCENFLTMVFSSPSGIKRAPGDLNCTPFVGQYGIDQQKRIDVLDARATRSKSFNADIIALHNGSVLFVRRYKK